MKNSVESMKLRNAVVFSSHQTSLDIASPPPVNQVNDIMDLLKSLNLDDLPEQQTRITISDPDFDLKLGFDSCCVCGKASTKIECSSCHRVKYCSKECRRIDAEGPNEDVNGDDGGDQALGHSSVICALLGLCNDDEAIDEGDEKELCSFSKERRVAASDRVASEFESYPASLANIIMEAPCFQEALEKSRASKLTIHVVGASQGVELWGEHPDKMQERDVFKCYADALAETADRFQMKSILLHFFGPECPKTNVDETIEIQPMGTTKKSSTKLRVTSSNVDYDGAATTEHQSTPDILVFFNPGFTCPDYAWEKTLSSCMKDKRFPFLVTTNTEMEALADMQYLFDRDFFQDIPQAFKAMLENSGAEGIFGDEENQDGENDEDMSSFFSLNPYCGLRVRQSGTMANDLFVKSRWIFGGFSGPRREAVPSGSKTSKSSQGKRKRVEGAQANNKKSNPALV